MTRIKICGITDPDDAALAVEAGADALGFNFVPGTPRCIPPEIAGAIIAGLPPFVTCVGVFLDQSLEDVLRASAVAGVGAVQLHGSEGEDFARRIPLKVIKAIPVSDAASLRRMLGYPAHAFLLDSHRDGEAGGTGRTFPWDLAREAGRHGRIVLAGGLTPANVAEAVRCVRPFAVDVASGVERRPGVKDPQKVRDFVAAVRRADAA
ncbi:MAG TPA: phosphoribosylanthranilate isomerase [Candidatus Methylomirabilis sp.]|jgi:phosphoribosylanthranilate isomerase